MKEGRKEGRKEGSYQVAEVVYDSPFSSWKSR